MRCMTCGKETDRYCVYHYGYECEDCHVKKPINKEPPDLVYGPRLPRREAESKEESSRAA